MQSILTLLIALVIGFGSVGCSTKTGASDDTNTFFGHWEGSISTPDGGLRLFLHVEQDSAGGYKAFIDSPDQLAFQIPVTIVNVREDTIDLKIVQLMADYVGKLSATGQEIVGQWEQGMTVAQLTMKRNDDVAFVRPQEPKAPYPYAQEELKITLRDKGTLAGTLTLPQGNGPFPVAVLISGSGVQDRDETIAGHKPFLVLADHLTRNGIAVFRYDDRGAGSSKAVANVAADEVAKDVVEIIRTLKSNAKIDQNKIGLIGHSEGGFVSGIAAELDPSIRYAVLVASPSLPGDSILKLQYDKIAGNTLPASMRVLQRRSLELIKSINDSATLRRELEKLYIAAYDSAGPQVHGMYKTGKAFAAASLPQLMSKPLQFLVRYDPRRELAKLSIPVLAIYGAKDMQVPAPENEPAMRQALSSNPRAQVVVLPDLNHLMQTAKTGELKEYGTIKETFSPIALKAITDWIKSTVK
ncbi:MAG TPA: alpha/beta hydrolase [Candidatus Kapabacteria bacterium]|nr:alpha/beta hydrolase [Candidatus Kapabacteria bacterium]